MHSNTLNFWLFSKGPCTCKLCYINGEGLYGVEGGGLFLGLLLFRPALILYAIVIQHMF